MHRFAGEPLLHPELAAIYDAFETPRAVRGEIELLDARRRARVPRRGARARAARRIDARGVDPVLHELVLRHELQHTETMRQAMALGRAAGPRRARACAPPAAGGPAAGRRSRRRRPARGRPRTASPTTTSGRARRSTSAAFRSRAGRSRTRPGWPSPRAAATSAASGGPRRAGRGRRSTTSRTLHWPARHEAGHPDAPVVPRVLVRGRRLRPRAGARLPTETEWEKAATWPGRSTAPATSGSGPRPIRRLPGLRRAPLPRVLRGLLRQRLPRAARRLVGDAPARRHADVPQLGPARSAARSSPACGSPRDAVSAMTTRDHRRRLVILRRPRRRARARRRRARRPHAAVQGAAAQALLRRAGAELFDRICELPEYYPTRAERAILERARADIAPLTGAAEIVELGSGTAAKTRAAARRVAAAGTLRRYVPVDVTEGMVARCADGARRRATRAARPRHRRRLRAPPGARPARRDGPARSSRSSAARSATSRPARGAASCARSRALLRPGVDHCCSAPTSSRTPRVLEAAYDDSAGVTAEFNRNVLRVINRELDADFDLEAFEHVAFFDREREWIEMRLRAQQRMDVRVAALGLDVEFAAARGAAHRDQRQVHDQAPGRRPGGRRPRAARRPHRPRGALCPVAQLAASGMTARRRVP